jgi:hypothetical protein
MRIFFGRKAMLGFAALRILSLGTYGAGETRDNGKDTDSDLRKDESFIDMALMVKF